MNLLYFFGIIFSVRLFCFTGLETIDCKDLINGDTGIIPLIQQDISVRSITTDKIGQIVYQLSSRQNTAGLLSYADTLRRSLEKNTGDTSYLSDLNYYIGVCYLFALKYEEAVHYLEESVKLKESYNVVDDKYLKALFNLSVAYNHIGDYSGVKNYLLKYIGLSGDFYGESSSEVATAYRILIGAAIVNNDYKNFIEYTDIALGLIKALDQKELSNLYSSIGTGHARMGDYAKARIYFEQAESVIENNPAEQDQNYITLINSMAINYGYLGITQKEDEYFRKGIELAVKDNSFLSFNMIHTFAIALGNNGNIQKGEALLSGLVEKSKKYYGTDSRYYIEVLKNYAAFLLNYKNDSEAAIKYFSVCNDYLQRHSEDASLRDPVYEGYARALHRNGRSTEAIEKIQELLFYGNPIPETDDPFKNPVIDSIRADKRYVRILRTKYEMLWDIYEENNDIGILKTAATTAELIIDLIDKIRINISEEESRIVLGDHYRDSYLMAIRDFELCYRKTADRFCLEKAFGIAERSKVAGLLAATRELNAIQLHIPHAIADYEKSLQREIGILNSKILQENEKGKPNKTFLNELNEDILVAIRARDSLILTFEKYYPEYFALKYNTLVPKMEDIPSIIGRKNNYINYIVSDSLLYVFIINRKYSELLTYRTDSVLFKKLGEFRDLLSNPSAVKDARSAFINYQHLGNDLYNILIEPLRKYFVSDNLLISPDSYLSYLPFETIVTSKYKGDGLLYRKLDYLMKKFNISYAYSATLMREIVSRSGSGTNNLAAFAPFYGNTINIDSLFSNIQPGEGFLYDLPYARQEAEFVAEISKGRLFLNDKAKESVYKSVAADYDIIHLAMHTFLNDQRPMNSAMIFSRINDDKEDGLLYTYEVYGIPLYARMVVLSSCNTGTGVLSTGEGILSLARGFLYSGSRSVVMSMWEIEDKSGTEIISRFYENLKKGNTKSIALRKSRSDYLKNATQFKSHPYFWATLIIYGDNSPVYYPLKVIIPILLVLILAGFLIFRYSRKRKYS